MTTEFTGERVVPGQVDADLWNEHFARYAFVAALAENRRVLDAGCGTGYGSAELARTAAEVAGIDLAPDAIAFAREQFSAWNLRFTAASCVDLPFSDASFDLVVCFEVIEHLKDWPRLIAEARRVLATGGHFVVSTPNKSFYAETRRESGPNPFHEHEFEYSEFTDALSNMFPNVAIYLQDHVEGVVFRRPGSVSRASVRIDKHSDTPDESSFFIAICSAEPIPDLPAFVYLPRTANALAEKLVHIRRLEGEVATKDRWIAQEQAAHQELLRQHGAAHEELKAKTQWAQDLASQLQEARQRIVAVQAELAAQQEAARAMASGYEQQVEQLQNDLAERTQWAQDTEQRLTAELQSCIADRDHQTAELGRCVELLHETEKTLEERTRWAVSLDEERTNLAAAVQASRWIRLGRALGVGPELKQR